MRHELQDAGCNPTPELEAGEDGAGGKLGLILVLQGRSGGRLLAVDGPQLGEHEGVEQRAHVQHRRLAAHAEARRGKACEMSVDITRIHSLFILPDLGLFWEADEDDDEMIRDVGAGIERDGHAGGGALVQGAVCQGSQKEPGQLTDVGHTLDELLGPAETRQRCTQ